MDRILHDASYSQEILQLTADTLILVDAEGVCRDVSIHSDLCFMQEKYLLGKNVFDILPEHTRNKVYPEFKRVLNEKVSVTKNFKLPFTHKTYYFKCIMQPYRDMVLCQYRDITERCNIRLELEKANERFKEIQRLGRIAIWRYSLLNDAISYDYSPKSEEKDGKAQFKTADYVSHIYKEDKELFLTWLNNSINNDTFEPVSYRIHHDNDLLYIRMLAYTRIRKGSDEIELEGYIQDMTEIRRKERNLDTLTHAIKYLLPKKMVH